MVAGQLKILVTGATGMVGLHIVKHLLREGHAVKAAVRKTSDISQLRSLNGLEVVVAELDDKPRLVQVMQGLDVVVHAAGMVDPLGARKKIFAVNVEGLRSVLEAAVSAQVKQFIQISSLSVITGQKDQYDVDEKASLVYCGESYADSKVAAEELVMDEAPKGRIAVTILRPGFIYGPFEKAWMPRLITSLAQGKAMLIDGGGKETNVIYVENLCLAVEGSLINPKAFGQVYNLTDGQRISKKQLFDTICDGLHLKRINRKMPSAVAGPFCNFVSTIAPLFPLSVQRNLGRYSRAAYRLAGVNQGFSIAKAERDLDYKNRIPFEVGMAKTLKEYAAHRTDCLDGACGGLRRDLTGTGTGRREK